MVIISQKMSFDIVKAMLKNIKELTGEKESKQRINFNKSKTGKKNCNRWAAQYGQESGVL